jgi:serine/threonine-protein kinase HipA
MKLELEVYYNSDLIGYLVEEESGRWAFSYATIFLQNRTLGGFLSLKFPPRDRSYRDPDLASFFRNLLPDGDVRRQLALKIGVSQGNDFALLGAIAGDCPGALRLSAPGEFMSVGSELRLLNEQDLRNVVAALPQHPLLVDVEGARFSLPGEHHKIAVRAVADQIALTFGNTFSSHIAKPAKNGLRESIMNEGFCLRLAAEMRLPAAKAVVRQGAVSVLLIERLDRLLTNGIWWAIHMEDFCQLMGVPPEQKFEREGGLGIADCVLCIKRYSTIPAVDMRSLFGWLVFNFLIGNGGAHAKQLAMHHLPNGPRLTPFYGLMSTHVYGELNHRMAMAIGGEERPDWVIPERWRTLAHEADVRPSYVLEIVRDMAERIPVASAKVADLFQQEYGYASIIRDIRGLIERRARQLLVSLEAERV